MGLPGEPARAQTIVVAPPGAVVLPEYDPRPRVRYYAAPYAYGPAVDGAYGRRVYAPPPAEVDYVPAPAFVMVPLRPSSCGRYRYWDGDRCLDARYDPPYIGPRW
jgi:hypothetical protein